MFFDIIYISIQILIITVCMLHWEIILLSCSMVEKPVHYLTKIEKINCLKLTMQSQPDRCHS